METKQEYQKVIDYLCQLIEEKKILPGDKFPTERALSEHLAISRNSIREALRMMETMGVLERRQGSGNYMIENMSASVRHLISMMLMTSSVSRQEVVAFRTQMEKAVCSVIIEQEDADLNDWCETIKHLLDAPVRTLDEEVERDKQFHFQLIAKTNNRFWILLMDGIMDLYREWIDDTLRNSSLEKKQALLQAHFSILNGIQTRDLQICMQAIEAHYGLLNR